ncbi:SRPBCC family protein [Actinoplanes sp. CA-142083]|uniref:SRPBCC family protein n=1 Tax=Actinoplanes sp. CA-142083 TaxID=3239903 RepID=UPI003D8A9CAF
MIEVVTVVGAAASTVFDLELDVDVHAASLRDSRETATTSSGRRRLVLGDEVAFRARHFGLPWRMTSRISAYDRPRYFADEQVRGPFRSMRHEHHFEELGDMRTKMTDRMTISAPLGMSGVIAPYLKRLLTRRAMHIKRQAEA